MRPINISTVIGCAISETEQIPMIKKAGFDGFFTMFTIWNLRPSMVPSSTPTACGNRILPLKNTLHTFRALLTAVTKFLWTSASFT